MITVNGLASVGSLGLTFVAGATGGHRVVTWAHAVDLPDPWRWPEAHIDSGTAAFWLALEAGKAVDILPD